MIGIMIEINIWKDWILNHVVIKFGWMKVDIGGDMMMSSHVIWIYQYQYYIFSIDVYINIFGICARGICVGTQIPGWILV